PPWLVPADNVAPVGTPLIVTANVSEPSVSVRPAEMASGIAVSSLPDAGVVDSVGASATALTVTARLDDVDAVTPPVSVEVAVTPSVKSASEFAGGVIVRPASWADVNVKTPPPWFVPADSVAPAGTPEIVTASVSEPSVSVRPAEMASG